MLKALCEVTEAAVKYNVEWKDLWEGKQMLRSRVENGSIIKACQRLVVDLAKSKEQSADAVLTSVDGSRRDINGNQSKEIVAPDAEKMAASQPLAVAPAPAATPLTAASETTVPTYTTPATAPPQTAALQSTVIQSTTPQTTPVLTQDGAFTTSVFLPSLPSDVTSLSRTTSLSITDSTIFDNHDFSNLEPAALDMTSQMTLPDFDMAPMFTGDTDMSNAEVSQFIDYLNVTEMNNINSTPVLSQLPTP